MLLQVLTNNLLFTHIKNCSYFVWAIFLLRNLMLCVKICFTVRARREVKLTVPSYYDKFRCIADKCRHSCCIGWEIDIDEETMELYDTLEGEFGDKIRANIEGEAPHFKLNEQERCPFLKKDGFCEIICELGEDALCDICYLHPRFQNDYETFTETGLGMCCEEAARIILDEEERFYINVPENAIEKQFFKRRKEIFDILQNREKTVKERFEELGNIDFSINELYEKYLSLERLDEEWTLMLNKIKNSNFDANIFENKDFQLEFEQLAVYFVFRHYAKVLKGEDENKILNFVIVSCFIIGILWSIGEDITEVARMYSSEIEYCEENLYALL